MLLSLIDVVTFLAFQWCLCITNSQQRLESGTSTLTHSKYTTRVEEVLMF